MNLVVSFDGPEPDTYLPSSIEETSGLLGRQDDPAIVVGGVLSDEDREEAIQRARDAMEAAWNRWQKHDNPADYNDAKKLQNIMATLIRGRSAAQVARMEKERGLSA